MSSIDELRRNPGQILGAITRWANDAKAINLGQGFPELSDREMSLPARVEFLQNAKDALVDYSAQQYPPPRGIPELQEAIAQSNQKYYDLATDPETEVLVTQGATAAIFYALNTLLKEPDDRNEVLLIEPFFNFYQPIIQDAGGQANHFSLEPNDNKEWVLDIDEFKRSITDKTKVILLNSPMNPNGKVFSREELEAIAKIVLEKNLYVVCDEVYEFYTPEGQPHIPLATIDGMKDRCIRVSSVGKTFAVTGWRVGYASGPEHIINRMFDSHFYISGGVSRAFQKATAYGLQQDSFLRSLGESYKEKSQILADGLRQAGFLVSPPQGGYFVAADYSQISDVDGIEFVEHMIHQHGVAAVPFDPPFVTSENAKTSKFLRFCVAKPEKILRESVARLQGIEGPR